MKRTFTKYPSGVKASTRPKAVRASDDLEDIDDSAVAPVCQELLKLVNQGIITDDEYDDINEILHRYLAR